ncbi:hypothetical protein BC332_16570 [Capsicum chinense]|nr:hypothetical protein BC332_16570 [Capsicum chinense]
MNSPTSGKIEGKVACEDDRLNVQILQNVGPFSKEAVLMSFFMPTNITALQREGSHDSDEFVSGPDLMEPPSTAKTREGPTYVSCNKVKATLDSDTCKPPLVVMLMFDGKKAILDAQKNYVSSLWTVIQGKFSKCDVDYASSLKDEVQVIIKKMDCKDMDISPLRKLLHFFFDLATLCDQTRSMLHDINKEAARAELFFVAGERLSNVMLEEDEQVRATSSIQQSLHNMKKKIKELYRKAQVLESLLTEAENEAQEAKLEASVAAKEFDTSFDADLSNGVDQRKEHLEVMRQDLINYKLCLDSNFLVALF